MNDFMDAALAIVEEQAEKRTMTADEILVLVRTLAFGLKKINTDLEKDEAEDCCSEEPEKKAVLGQSLVPACDPAEAIQEDAIICLEC